MKEFKDVLNRKKFDFSLEQIGKAVKDIISISEIITSSTKPNIILEDPEDNKVLETAVDGNANFIISGDKHLLKLREFRNIKIVTAGKFLEMFSKSDN